MTNELVTLVLKGARLKQAEQKGVSLDLYLLDSLKTMRHVPSTLQLSTTFLFITSNPNKNQHSLWVWWDKM